MLRAGLWHNVAKFRMEDSTISQIWNVYLAGDCIMFVVMIFSDMYLDELIWFAFRYKCRIYQLPLKEKEYIYNITIQSIFIYTKKNKSSFSSNFVYFYSCSRLLLRPDCWVGWIVGIVISSVSITYKSNLDNPIH